LYINHTRDENFYSRGATLIEAIQTYRFHFPVNACSRLSLTREKVSFNVKPQKCSSFSQHGETLSAYGVSSLSK